jgi:NADPH:quinone reductase-like Zn-dependent oxidoreductase
MTASNLPTHMRSAQWTTVPIESSLVVNSNTPLPKLANSLPKDSALVKVSYASLNPVDYKLAEFGLVRFARMGAGPWIPGSDYSGVVVSTNLSHVRPGDRVFGCTAIPNFGTFADYAIIEGTENVAKLPDGVDLKDAATLGIAAQMALQCLVPYVKEGDHVLINGASGGTGTFGIQIAKVLGCVVTAICSGSKTGICKNAGADTIIDYKMVDVVEELKKSSLQYDLIVDNVEVGGPIYTQSHHYLKETGRYVTVAIRPDLSSAFDVVKTMVKPAWLGGGQRKAELIGRKPDREGLVKLAGWVRDGKLKPYIEKQCSLVETAGAFEWLKTGKDARKIVGECVRRPIHNKYKCNFRRVLSRSARVIPDLSLDQPVV